MEKHSLDGIPCGLVTRFAGDLTPDMPTLVLPVVDDTTDVLPIVDDEPSTERFFVPWFDAANALVRPVGEPDSIAHQSWAMLLKNVPLSPELPEPVPHQRSV